MARRLQPGFMHKETLLKALIALTSALLLAGIPLLASAVEAEVVVDGIPHQALFDVDLDGDTGYAVGAGGQILRTTDAGASWQAENLPTPIALMSVAAAGEHVIAVGQMGTIFTRAADGSWNPADSGSPERLMNVDVNDRGQAVAVGAFGAILRSDDGGRSWANAAPETWAGVFEDRSGSLGDFFQPSVYVAQIADDGRAWIAGELGLIARSDDAGKTWTIAHAGGSGLSQIDPTISGLVIRADGTGFATGQSGFLMKTTDSGKTWTKLPAPTKANLFEVTSTPDGMVLATGMRDMVLSTDNGQTWSHVNALDIRIGWYRSVTPTPDQKTLLVVGHSGRLLRLTP